MLRDIQHQVSTNAEAKKTIVVTAELYNYTSIYSIYTRLVIVVAVVVTIYKNFAQSQLIHTTMYYEYIAALKSIIYPIRMYSIIIFVCICQQLGDRQFVESYIFFGLKTHSCHTHTHLHFILKFIFCTL